MKWCRKAAEQGYAKAQYNLGGMYDKGQGVPQDDAEAVKWYRKAAEQGDAEAGRWWRKAAEQGDATAQLSLGLMYGMGQGVPQDYVQAHMWFNLAVSKLPPGEAHDRAVKNSDIAAKRMTPAEISEAQKLAREWRPK